jgi:hydrogenase maturation protease
MLDGRAEISRPGPESVLIDGVAVAAGSRVILRPRTTATDVLMRAVAGRRAIVESVVQDTDDQVRLTVTVEGDPIRSLGKGRGLGHRFFFNPEELEPVAETGRDAPPPRVLVAGIGNVFMGDDGFGVAVVGALSGRVLPDGVDLVDFGIRGMDLAYALVDGYDAAVLVDLAQRGQPPGTLELIEPEIDPNLFVGFQAHRMDPVAVLQFARQFGSLPRRTLIVACEPHAVLDPDSDELRDELSPPVARAVEHAAALIEELVADLGHRPANDNEGVKR